MTLARRRKAHRSRHCRDSLFLCHRSRSGLPYVSNVAAPHDSLVSFFLFHRQRSAHCATLRAGSKRWLWAIWTLRSTMHRSLLSPSLHALQSLCLRGRNTKVTEAGLAHLGQIRTLTKLHLNIWLSKGVPSLEDTVLRRWSSLQRLQDLQRRIPCHHPRRAERIGVISHAGEVSVPLAR